MINDRLHAGTPNTFTGMNLIEDPTIPEKVPRVQLSSKVDVSSDFREEFNAWLLRRFGADRVVCVIDGNMVTNPVNVAKLTQPK